MSAHRGFTLIEVLAATVLSAIMMTALMSVTTAIARNEPADSTVDQSASWRHPVVEVFRRDLAHADTVEASPSRVTLTGHVAINRETMSPTHQPAVVVYNLRRLADRSWLIRTQTDTEDRSLHNTWVQLVCAGVLSFEVQPVVQTEKKAINALDPPSPAPEPARALAVGADPSVSADTAKLTITWVDNKQSTTSVVLISR